MRGCLYCGPDGKRRTIAFWLVLSIGFFFGTVAAGNTTVRLWIGTCSMLTIFALLAWLAIYDERHSPFQSIVDPSPEDSDVDILVEFEERC